MDCSAEIDHESNIREPPSRMLSQDHKKEYFAWIWQNQGRDQQCYQGLAYWTAVLLGEGGGQKLDTQRRKGSRVGVYGWFLAQMGIWADCHVM